MWPKYNVIIHARHNAFGTREAFFSGQIDKVRRQRRAGCA